MSVNEHSVEIALAADELWPWLVEPERLKRWVGGLRQFVPMDEGEPRAGARSTQTILVGGREWKLLSEIVRYEPPRRFEVRSEHASFNVTQAYSLDAAGDGTRLSCRVETRFRGVFGRMMGAAAGAQGQRKLADDLARLKELAEAGEQRK